MQKNLKKESKKKQGVVMTGGHAGTTAIAVVEAYKGVEQIRDIHWIGARKAMAGAKDLSFEFRVLPQMGVRCWGIVSGKFQSKFTRHTIPGLMRIPIGFLYAFYLLARIRPKVVLSFGGFAGVPVVVAAWVYRIPVVIHEQIAAAGLGNRLSAPFAKKIAVARKDSFEFFSNKKTVLVGNPIRKNIADLEPKRAVPKKFTLYIQGGSRGAVRINTVVEEALRDLLEKYKIIHITGEQDNERFSAIQHKNYKCYSFRDPFEVYKSYRDADVVIGRAGANTVSEALVAGRLAIYIPIPWTRYDEQGRNARYAKRLGMASIIEEKELTAARLVGEIEKMVKNWEKMIVKGNSRKARVDELAAEKLVEMVEEELV